MRDDDARRADRELRSIVPGMRKCSPRSVPCTRYAGWSGFALKVEAIRLQPLSGKSKSAAAREFGVARETLKDWLDLKNRPRSFPPEELVEWLACIVDARSLVRRAS